MCGICGFTGESNQAVLKKMNDAISHRGPDEEGFYANGRVNLGSRRLSIIDIFSGKQPMHNETKTVWTVWNGEIYNFKELRRELFLKGHEFYTNHSDTEVIVHLYEDYGTDFVDKINGMFAIAIYEQINDKLVLVRDRMGVKPLFYSIVNNNLIFGSEIKAILEHPSYQKRVNYSAIYHYFSFKNVPAPLSAFKDIYSLLPGELIEFNINSGKIQKQRYWKINFGTYKNFVQDEIQSKIMAILQDAVKIRMVSDVPIGAYLSGGVDSSAVVSLMSQFSNQPVKTFSLGYETKLKNKEEDLFFARKVSEYFKTDHYEYIMSSKEIPDDIDKIIRSFDQPFSGVISTYYLSKLITKHVKVALSGDGADELFGSYLPHRLAQPMNNFSSLYPLYKTGTLSESQKLLLAPFEHKLDYLEKLYLLSDGDEKLWRYSLFTFSDEEKNNILSPEFCALVGKERTQELVATRFSEISAVDPLNRMLEFDWNTLLPDQVLAFVDFLSMAHSVEVRSPFMDYRLVELVASIPGTMKIKNGIVKDLLKRTVAEILPSDVITRPKEGFVLPIFDWMTNELKDYIIDFMSEDSIKQSGFFNYDGIKKIVARYYEGDTSLASKVWNITMFQVWWSSYFG